MELKKRAVFHLKEVKEHDHNQKMRYKGLVPLPAAKSESVSVSPQYPDSKSMHG